MKTMPDYVIDVKKLNKTFNGKPAVVDLTLQVKKGEIFGFLGPNGSGKTTTIRMICGLLIPDSGEGTCLGLDLIKQADEIKRQVGYMTQRFSLYDELTVAENLDFLTRVYRIKNRKKVIEAIIDQFDLSAHANQLAKTLSGGWKQRLALAAAVVHKPKLLLLDEPTAGIDPQARRDFWKQVHEFSQQGITTFVSTHYMDEAVRCTRLAYISKGKLLTQGTADEIIADSGLNTWRVEGGNIIKLSSRLQQLKGVEQIVPFGNILHVSGRDEALLEKAIEKVKREGEEWQRIQPSLEDVFITLVGDRSE